MKPLISICIPTFNRSFYLNKTLETIVTQRIFIETSLIEIVISDNKSSDDTFNICNKYICNYPNKIKYYCNDVNIGPENVNIAFTKATGVYLKLNNDTLCHSSDSLALMVEIVNSHFEKKDFIFFSNGLFNESEKFRIITLNNFIKSVSYYSTWIISFGIWREDFIKIKNIETINSTSLINNVLFDQIIQKNGVYIVDNKIFFPNDVPQKGGYNFYEVFIHNYITILEEYHKNGKIRNKTLFYEKANLLVNFLIPWEIRFFKYSSLYSFDRSNKIKYFLSKYKYHPILYLCPFIYGYKLLKKN